MSIELQRALAGTPDHWRILKVKHIAKRFYGGGTPDSGNKDYYSDSGTSWMMISDLTRSPFVSSTRKHLSRAGVDSKGLRILPAGCIVYSMYASVGAVATLHIETAINQAIIGIEVRQDRILGRFLHLYLEAVRPIVYAASNASTQANLNAAKVKNFPVPTPPLEEQRLIVRYLDNAELRIAKAIQAKLQLVNLFRERRRVIVEEHVLRGVGDPDSGTLIDSEVPWLGAVPHNWSLLPFRGLFSPRRRLVGSRSSEFTLLSLTLGGVIVRDLSQMKGKFPASFDTYQEVRPGDLVMCLFDVDETPRTVGLSQHHGMITGAYDVFEARDPLTARFAELQLLAIDAGKKFRPLYRGLRKVVPTTALSGARLCLPSRDRMAGLIEAVSSSTAATDAALESLNAEIALLREYRTRLISDVVTGKKDVRAEAATMKDVDPAELAAVLAGTATGGHDEGEGEDDAE